MVSDMKPDVIEMNRRSMISVNGALGGRIDCLRGRIWITEAGCGDDIVLEAGDSYVISRDGVVLVQALRQAFVGVGSPIARHAGRGIVPGVKPREDVAILPLTALAAR
jgi:hypothetical protein